MKRIALALLLLLPCAAHAQDPGIYADFSTSLGNFTARLDYERAPKAVAAFVGLATGEKAWLDPFGNVYADTPFYDGTLFHRVIPGVAVQGGGKEAPCDVWSPSNGVENVFGPITIGPLELSIPPGITTNLLYDGSFAFTNAPGEPATVVRGGESVEIMQTNRAIHSLQLDSTASFGGGAPSVGTTNYYFTNFNATTVQTVTNVPFPLVITLQNPTDTPLPFTYSAEIRWSTTNTLFTHSVATNFSNAGFFYPDNFSNGLAHTAGTLAMAHNTFANTDGSQFFVFATNAPGWDGSYTVFGQVVDGLDVVRKLAAVPVDATNDNRPTNDIVLRNVTIRRVGDAARDFDIHAQRLPVVDSLPAVMIPASDHVDITFDIPAQTEVLLRLTTNLLRTGWGAWELSNSGYIPNAASFSSPLMLSPDRLFLHVSAVTYPDAWTLPESIGGHTFSFVWDTEPPTTEIFTFVNSLWIPGSYTRTRGTNTVSGKLFFASAAWTRQPYSAKLFFSDDYPPVDPYYNHTYMLRWDPGAAFGTATGCILPPGTSILQSVSGTFTLDNTP